VDEDIDSTQLLGRPDAAHIPKQLPGRAYLRVGADDVTPVQTASVSARRSAGEGRPRVDARPFLFSPMPARRLPDATASAGPAGPLEELTDLQRIVAAIGAAARLAGEPAPPPVA
jgi:DNA segregation ATPase FtsK/SpoIIIE, S-DNA-T family